MKCPKVEGHLILNGWVSFSKQPNPSHPEEENLENTLEQTNLDTPFIIVKTKAWVQSYNKFSEDSPSPVLFTLGVLIYKLLVVLTGCGPAGPSASDPFIGSHSFLAATPHPLALTSVSTSWLSKCHLTPYLIDFHSCCEERQVVLFIIT